ncbi:hypothetical protein GCM10010199_33370 [Dactylosporangium roseum]
MEKLVEQLGIASLSRSQVSEMAAHLDAQVEAFGSRPLDAAHYTFVWMDALVIKVREHGRTVAPQTLTQPRAFGLPTPTPIADLPMLNPRATPCRPADLGWVPSDCVIAPLSSYRLTAASHQTTGGLDEERRRLRDHGRQRRQFRRARQPEHP